MYQAQKIDLKQIQLQQRQMLCMLPLFSLNLSNLDRVKKAIEQMTDEEKSLLGSVYRGGGSSRAFRDSNFMSFLETMIDSEPSGEPEASVRFNEKGDMAIEYATAQSISEITNGDAETKSFIRNPLRVLKDIEYVAGKIKEMYGSVVLHQQDYLATADYNKLRQLSQTDIGEEIGLHQSTVSRLLKNREIRTPQGDIMSLISLVPTDDVVQRLKAYAVLGGLIKDGHYPESDEEASRIIREKTGLNFARRTVVKYRNALYSYLIEMGMA